MVRQDAPCVWLHLLRAHHMPELEVIFIEEPDPDTPYAVRGVGESGTVPTAPAVAGALEASEGVHRTSLLMKDSPAAQGILDPPKRGRAGILPATQRPAPHPPADPCSGRRLAGRRMPVRLLTSAADETLAATRRRSANE